MANNEKYINPGILNEYSVRPKNLTMYKAFRGVTDFTQIGQFNQFETGYSFLSVIAMPRFIDRLCAVDDNVKVLRNDFKHMLEYEFRGLSGLGDITGQTGNITDGINEMNYINKVTMDTSITVSMPFFEKSGSVIERFTEYYLTGIKDRMSQAKTYHGLIQNNLLDPGLENEVFTLLYYVTDNTYLRLERAILLANAQLTTAEVSMYDSTRGDINNREVTISFNAFPIMGRQVDKAAYALLQDITGVHVEYEDSTSPLPNYSVVKPSIYLAYDAEADEHGYKRPERAVLDSNDYKYGIMNDPTTSTDTTGESIPSVADVNGDAEGSSWQNIYGEKLLAKAIEKAGTGIKGSATSGGGNNSI